MRRIVWLGAAALIALAAAIPLWLVLDDDGGDRRAAALQEPTAAGEVARLTLTGQKGGVVTVPVQSFSWGMTSPRDAASGQATGQVRFDWLQIIKPVDSSSPLIFNMLVSHENIPTAKLELLPPGSVWSKASPYMSYTFTNANIANWDDGSNEKLKLTFASYTTLLGVGKLPGAPAAQVIGVMTAPTIGPGKMPLLDFSTGVVSPRDAASGLPTGKRAHKPATVLRAIDSWDSTVLTKAGQNATLGDITIELQRPGPTGVPETYATYIYRNASAVSVEDAGAAGAGVATQKLQLVFAKVEVKAGANTAIDDWESPAA